MTQNEQLFWALGYCIFILVLFLIVKKFPPKKINWWYGYRTARSMQNDEIWKVAQAYASKKSIQLALLSFIFPPLLYVTIPEYNFLITVVINSILILMVIYFTENYLKKHH